MLGRILAGASALALALGLAWLYGNARHEAGVLQERVIWTRLAADTEQKRAVQSLQDERRVATAVAQYAQRVAALEPIIIRSTDTVTRYAQTPAGAAPCLAADRVSGIDADAAALGLQPAIAPESGERTLPADPDPPE